VGGRAASYLRSGVAMAISQSGTPDVKHDKMTILWFLSLVHLLSPLNGSFEGVKDEG
jgi:hypothetical protein